MAVTMMKKMVLLLLFFAMSVHAQSYTGLIDNTRASAGSGGLGTNGWAAAGVIGGIPSGTWTQCGATIAAYTGNTDTINKALNHTAVGYTGCGANTYVLLGSGTFNLSSGGTVSNGIKITTNGTVLRGSGADQTFLVFSSGAWDSCSGGYHTGVCFNGSGGRYWVTDGNSANWTAGYAQGTSVVTLSSTTGLVANQSVIGLDQCSLGNSGYPCTANAEVDNGNFFDCDVKYSAPNGCADNGPDGGNQRLNRPQNELFLITAVNSGTGQVTLNGSLRNPNWSASMTPAAFFSPNPVRTSGVEALSIDVSASGASMAAIVLYYTANCWVKGTRIVKYPQAGIMPVVSTHDSFVDNYFYGTTHTPGTDSFNMYGSADSDNLWQNNIGQWTQVCMGTEGADTGSVYGYNYCINDYEGGGALYAASFQHGGDRYQLNEGNIFNGYYGENLHGPKVMTTLFRNMVTGWESCANGSVCGSATFKGGGGNGTTAVRFVHHSRYPNVIANVLGTPGYHNGYISTSGTTPDLFIYSIGGSSAIAPTDTVVASTRYLWGNWDSVTNAIRWCGNSSDTGWVAVCGSASEVPTGFSPFGQPLPTVGDTGAGMSALPASLYLASKPAWFGSLAFPGIGPDISSGTVGQCTGTWGIGVSNVAGQYGGVPATSSSQCTGTSLAAAWGGHVNANPAMNCFLNVMHGPPDGSNTSPLAFNANTCYASSSQAATPTFCIASVCGGGTFVGTQTVTIATATASAIICWNKTGAPATNGLGTGCTTGTLINASSGTISVSVSETVFAVAGTASLSDSSIGSATYTIINATLPAPCPTCFVSVPARSVVTCVPVVLALQ